MAVAVLLLLLLSLPSLALGADSGEAKAKKTAPPKTMTVEGVVVGAAGEPVAGAKVRMLHNGEPLTAMTDHKGRFSFEAEANYVPGNVLHAEGPDGTLGQVQLPYDRDVVLSGRIKPQRIELKPPRVIEATVVDAAGKPVPGAEVVVNANYRAAATATTDDAGRASLNLPQDVPLQFVLAAKEGVGVDYALYRDPQMPKSDPYQLPQDHHAPVKLELQPTRMVKIRAVDHESRPVAGAEVTPWLLGLAKRGGDANLGLLWTTKTDADGIANFPHIPVNADRPMVFWVRKDGLIAPERTELEKGATDGTLTATLLPLVPVKGRVLHADGSPAADMPVIAAGDNHSMDQYREHTTTNSDGNFEISVYPDHYCMFVAGNEEFASPTVTRTVRLGKPIDDLELTLGPATRVHGRLTIDGSDQPAADQYVSLYQKPSPDYYELPEDERLPNPKESRFAVQPLVVRSMRTGADGRFEFFAGPGEFYIIVEQLVQQEAPWFTIADEPELELNLAIRKPPEGKLTGRVVLASNPQQGVPEVRLFGYAEDYRARHLDATTDAAGRFETRPVGAEALVGAFSEDKSLGGIVRVAADQREFTLELAPTATIAGTLIDEETGKPATAREVTAYIRIGPEHGPYMNGFPQTGKTDDEGRFEIAGLVPGHKYDMHVVAQTDGDGNAVSWRGVGKAEPSSAGKMQLGELRIPKPYRPSTVEDDIARAYAHKNPAKRLSQLLKDAKLAYNQVLVVAAAPGGKAARRYFEICHHYTTRPNELRPENLHEYMVAAIDPAKGADALAEHNLSAPASEDDATFAILDPDGSVIAQAAAADLSSDGELDHKKLAEFLANRRAPLPSARRLLEEALAEAERDDKRVLVQVGGPGCGWCVVLARYLDEQKQLVSKDYIHLKLDSRMPEAEEVIGELREIKEGGVPWMIILAADGTPLVTSDAKDGNIGYPGEPEGQKHWEKMLRDTRQRLSDADIAALMAPLQKED